MASGINIEALRAALQAEMDRKGIKAKPLAKAANLGETAVRDILEGRSNDPRVGTLVKLADFFGVSVSHFLGDEGIPLLGKVGAGGKIIFDETAVPELVDRPPGAEGPMMAMEVVGDSMLPKYEPGDIIYVRRDHDGVIPTYLGEYCAVQVRHAGTYLKILAPGTKPDLFTLRSLNAADMVDVDVEWASPVLFIMPRRSRRLRG